MKQITLVCKTKKVECDNKPYTVIVGAKHQTFCCQKGFNKTLEDFQNYISKKKP
jgi:hypothetical protein